MKTKIVFPWQIQFSFLKGLNLKFYSKTFMVPGISDWSEAFGCVWDYTATVADVSAPGAVPVSKDFTGMTGRMVICSESNPSVALLEFTTESPVGNPRMVLGNGTLRLRCTDMTQAQIEAALPVGDYVYSVSYKPYPDAGFCPLWGGRFTVFMDPSHKAVA